MIKAFLFSKGETTTDLAKWSLERLGHEVILLADPKTSFYQKYLDFLNQAKNEVVVIRADADVVALKRFNDLLTQFNAQKDVWWVTGRAFCYHRHDLIDGGLNIMNSQVISLGLQHFHKFKKESRPETALSRVKELFNPRRFLATTLFVGLHGYRQYEADIGRVMIQKSERNQLKDWDMDLIEKMKDVSV